MAKQILILRKIAQAARETRKLNAMCDIQTGIKHLHKDWEDLTLRELKSTLEGMLIRLKGLDAD